MTTTAATTTIERLRDWQPVDRLAGWLVSFTITALAFGIRVVNVGYPAKLVFDETYYARDAWSLLQSGYERDWAKDSGDSLGSGGGAELLLDQASFVVHPPLGKWLIGIGEWAFGLNSFGWRIMPVLFGTALVFMTIRLARRLSRSTLVGGIAGLLLAVDGLAFTMSRIALLDVFAAFFVVAGVAALAADRDWFRNRLADYLTKAGWPDLGGRLGPRVWWRPWRWVSGVMFGCAVGVKWNAIFFLAAFGVLTVWWDVSARRLAGGGLSSWGSLAVDGIPAFIAMVVTAGIVYTATWAGWFLSSGGWDRQWGLENADHALVKTLGPDLASWLWYHQQIYDFHVGDYIRNATHPYSSHPASWIIMVRPTGFDAVNDIAPGTDGCVGPDNCIRVISGMGTPLLWWLAAIALVVGLVLWWGGRDWRFGVPIVAVAAGWLPWFQHAERPIFFFYAITLVPFTTTALALVMGRLLGPPDAPSRRVRAMAVGLIVALIVANFAWLYPVLTDQLIPYPKWLQRMWLGSWI